MLIYHIFIFRGSIARISLMGDIVYKCRYVNTPYKELSLAAAEQMKITEIRLRQMVGEPPVTNAASQKAERRSGQTRAHLGKPANINVSGFRVKITYEMRYLG
jgi:hypothetical protein